MTGDITYRNPDEATDDVENLLLLNMEGFDPPITHSTAWVAVHLNSDTIFIAEVEGQPVGYVLGLKGEHLPDLGWTRQLYVREEWQRKGIGRSLMEHVEDAFRNKGATRAGLTTKAGSTGHAFFSAVGYAETKQVDDLYGEGEDRLVMEKQL